MFKINYKKDGLNSEKRSVANLSKRVFLCQEIKYPDTRDFDIKINKTLNNQINHGFGTTSSVTESQSQFQSIGGNFIQFNQINGNTEDG